MKPIFVIPFFTLCTSSKSIKLFGGQKFAFFCFRFWRKYVCESSWLNTGNFVILFVRSLPFCVFFFIFLAVYCL